MHGMTKPRPIDLIFGKYDRALIQWMVCLFSKNKKNPMNVLEKYKSHNKLCGATITYFYKYDRSNLPP